MPSGKTAKTTGFPNARRVSFTTRSVFAGRTGAGYFLDFDWNREELARYGLSIDEAQAAIQNAIGGENVTTTIEGRERYPVNVRYMRDFRSSFDTLGRVLVPAAGGQRHIPISQLAAIHAASGPSMVRNENGLLTGYVYVDIAGRDPSSYIEEARRLLRDNLKLPAGYSTSWSGQYEAMQRVHRRFLVVLPLTLFLILLLLYFNTRSLTKTAIIVLAVPFSAVGAIWFLYLLGYNISIGVWVGLIALLGVDARPASSCCFTSTLPTSKQNGNTECTVWPTCGRLSCTAPPSVSGRSS